MLQESDVASFTQKLLAEKKETEEQLTHLADDIDFGNEVDSLEEEADESEERANRLGVKGSLIKQLERIDAALAKITKGTYGRCEQCGGEISKDLLAVDPESTLCKECKRGAAR